MNQVEFESTGARILVTGATGLIGGGLARHLLTVGAEVRALVRRTGSASGLRAEGMDVAIGDLTDPSSLAKAVEGCDAVAHFAGVLGDEAVPWARFMAVNVEGTRSLLTSAVESGVRRFLYASSVWAYGFDAGPGTDETTPARPCGDPYCDTKLLAQNIVLDAARRGDVSAVVVQPSPVYGPQDDAWTAAPLRLLRRRLLAVPGRSGGMIQPLYVSDAVDGALAALTRGESGQAYIPLRHAGAHRPRVLRPLHGHGDAAAVDAVAAARRVAELRRARSGARADHATGGHLHEDRRRGHLSAGDLLGEEGAPAARLRAAGQPRCRNGGGTRVGGT